MRLFLLAFVTLLPFCSGCSCFIMESGFDLDKLENREQVYAKFGTPKKIEQFEPYEGVPQRKDIDTIETFVTRRKIHQRVDCGYMVIQSLTLGTVEMIAVPIVVGTNLYWFVAGREIEFQFDKKGRVIWHSQMPMWSSGRFFHDEDRNEEPQKEEEPPKAIDDKQTTKDR